MQIFKNISQMSYREIENLKHLIIVKKFNITQDENTLHYKNRVEEKEPGKNH